MIHARRVRVAGAPSRAGCIVATMRDFLEVSRLWI
ncbi:Uncharacterised protein [Bordetella pertussis]|nr:Uncharacterised protein [Bordetella pertussis]